MFRFHERNLSEREEGEGRGEEAQEGEREREREAMGKRWASVHARRTV